MHIDIGQSAALGAFLVSSESEAADVECFSSDASSEPVDMPGCTCSGFTQSRALANDNSTVNTETYHAQYRVIDAFSFFNVILSE